MRFMIMSQTYRLHISCCKCKAPKCRKSTKSTSLKYSVWRFLL